MQQTNSDNRDIIQGSHSNTPKRTWNRPEPCYMKVYDTALIALDLSFFYKTLKGLSLADKIIKIHQLHLLLDSIVIKYEGTKFSGSAESYLVIKQDDDVAKCAEIASKLVRELVEVGRKYQVKALATYGEVGFGLLGATAWNYQFYGDLVNMAKMKVTETNPGEILILEPFKALLEMNGNIKSIQSDKTPDNNMRGQSSISSISDQDKKVITHGIEDSYSKNKINKSEQKEASFDSEDTGDASSAFDINISNVSPNFYHWWSSRNQHTDIWVLILTLLLNSIMIKESLLGNSTPKCFVKFLQAQCFLVNFMALLVWAFNRLIFIRWRTTLMTSVWICQLFNRFIATTVVSADPRTFTSLPLIYRMVASNGLEKFLLMASHLNFWTNCMLHLLYAISSLYAMLPGNTNPEVRAVSQITASIGDSIWNMLPFYLCQIFMFSIMPIIYSSYRENQAKIEYHKDIRKKKGD